MSSPSVALSPSSSSSLMSLTSSTSSSTLFSASSSTIRSDVSTTDTVEQNNNKIFLRSSSTALLDDETNQQQTARTTTTPTATSSNASADSNGYILVAEAVTNAAIVVAPASLPQQTSSLPPFQQNSALSFKEIDYGELKFTSTKPLGRGAFGVVFAAEWRGTKVAVKKLMRFVDSVEEVADLHGECALMQRCSNHANVIRFVGACRDGGTYCIVSAFCAGGSVYDALIVRHESLSSNELLRILCQSVCGILHLHKGNVIHRDIAARNFLLDEQRNVFVTDFGMARIKTAAYQHTKSTLGPVKYMAPECIAKKRYSEQSDAYSFGVYIWEVTHRREPHAGVDAFEVARGIVSGSLRLTIDETLVGDAALRALMMLDCWLTDALNIHSHRYTSICS